jgi:hypothetical protein
MAKMNSAPITEKELSVEANFARRIGSSFTCRWLNVEWINIINAEEICQFLHTQFLTDIGDLSLMYVSVCIMCVNIQGSNHKDLNHFYLSYGSDNCCSTRAQ